MTDKGSFELAERRTNVVDGFSNLAAVLTNLFLALMNRLSVPMLLPPFFSTVAISNRCVLLLPRFEILSVQIR